MQAASMDAESTIWQNDLLPIQLVKAPCQQVAGMITAMATRNRTREAADTRKECVGLQEIDRTATKGDETNLASDDLTNLNMARTGSAWDRNTAFWAGQCEDQSCKICGEKEEADHIWTCKGLEKKRAEVDEDIAKLDPEKLPAAVKQGIAPAMNANPRFPYWGKQKKRKETIWLRRDSTLEERR